MESPWLEDANCESGKTWNEEVGLNSGISMAALRKNTRNSSRLCFVAAAVWAEHGPNTRIERKFWSDLFFILVSYARMSQCKILRSKEPQNSWQRRYYVRSPILKVTVQEAMLGCADFVDSVSECKISTTNHGTSSTKAFSYYETWLDRYLTGNGFRRDVNIVSCVGFRQRILNVSQAPLFYI